MLYMIENLNKKGMDRFYKLFHDEGYDKNIVRKYYDEYSAEVDKLSKYTDTQEYTEK